MNRPEDNASHEARWEMTNNIDVVVVHRPVKRTYSTSPRGVRTSRVHQGSLKAIIALARKTHPQYADAAVVHIWYGTTKSEDTVLEFDPAKPAIYGF